MANLFALMEKISTRQFKNYHHNLFHLKEEDFV